MNRIGIAMSRIRGPVNYYDLRASATPGTKVPTIEEPAIPTPKRPRSEATHKAAAEAPRVPNVKKSEAPMTTVTTTASTLDGYGLSFIYGPSTSGSGCDGDGTGRYYRGGINKGKTYERGC